MKRFALILLSLVMVLSFVGCGNKNEKSLVMGGKDYSEQDVLVQLVSELIEANTDIKVTRKSYLGGSSIVANSIETGDLDLYVEYTGTALMSVLNEEKMNDPDKVYELVKKRYAEEKDIKWLKPLGFNNTWAITMKESKIEELGIKSLTDLGPLSKDLIFASTQEFQERKDGYEYFKELYNIDFKEVKAMDPGLCYTAVKEDQVDVSVSYTTDGRIPAFELKVLEDDKNFFPPYYAVPIVRMDTLEKYPEIEDLLNSLAGKLTDDEMANLNAQVDIEKKDSKSVAKNWLKENGFIE